MSPSNVQAATVTSGVIRTGSSRARQLRRRVRSLDSGGSMGSNRWNGAGAAPAAAVWGACDTSPWRAVSSWLLGFASAWARLVESDGDLDGVLCCVSGVSVWQAVSAAPPTTRPNVDAPRNLRRVVGVCASESRSERRGGRLDDRGRPVQSCGTVY